MSKLLGDFLQEQQEPFAFLVERGCRKKRELVSPNCSAFLKAVFGLRFGRNALNLKGKQENGSEDRSSSVSSTSLFNSSSDRETANAIEEEVGAERKKKRRGDETESGQNSPNHCNQGKSSTSISHYKLKKHRFQRLKEVVGCDQYSVNMRALQQRKQLLIDCVREVMQNVEKREKEEVKKKLGTEEALKLVCENAWIWSQDSINGSNILRLLHSDFLDSEDEWNADFEQQKMEISNEVENAIFEDVINEIVITS